MSLETSTFNTAHVIDNEIIKANDFEFAFEKLIENVSKSTQMILESNQDFVINGKVLPYSGMNVQISPIYGVCKSTGIPFGRTETAVMEYGFEESSSGRVDIIMVKGEWETYDNQQRAFNDPDTDTQTYQYVDTKKLMRPVYEIKKGVEGSSVAPEVTDGYVKLAEIVIRANANTILESDIKNITADIAGIENDDWTTEKDITYNIGYISDVNARFRVAHNADGSHKEDCIDSTMLDIGTGVNQVNGNILPVGGSLTIPSQTAVSATDSILSVLTKAITVITTLYNNYLLYGTYGFKGEVIVSDVYSGGAFTNPLKLSAAGDGSAAIKIGNTTVISINTYGKLHANYNTLSSGDDAYTIVTKGVTDAITQALNTLTQRVNQIVETNDYQHYSNGVLSAGTDGRYNVDSTAIYAATTQNITLSGTQSIDGTSPVDGVFILVKDQTDATENGIYQYSSSSVWTRINDFLSPRSLLAKLFSVTNGTVNGKKMFYITNIESNYTDPDNFGTDDINFSEYFGAILPAPYRVGMRDASGHLKTAQSQSNNDCVNKQELITYNSTVARAMLDYIYPVGSLYWTSKAPDNGGNPNTLFGGTWTQIKDTFVWAKGDNTSYSDAGGSSYHLLSANELPEHTHQISLSNVHDHGMEHYHDRGDMEISASLTSPTWSTGANNLYSGTTGAFTASTTGTGDYLSSTGNKSRCKLSFTASRSWTGRTSSPYSTADVNDSTTKLSTDTSLIYVTGNTYKNTTTKLAFSIIPPYVAKYCWERTA